MVFWPFVVTGEPLPSAVEAGLIHLRLPNDAIRSGLEQGSWLADINDTPSGWRFGGLLPVDTGKPTRLSVRVLGEGPVPGSVRHRGAVALGTLTPPAPAVTMRVRGPGVAECTALGGNAEVALQAAAVAVFGPGVKVCTLAHPSDPGCAPFPVILSLQPPRPMLQPALRST